MKGREAVGSWLRSASRAQCRGHPHPYSPRQNTPILGQEGENPTICDSSQGTPKGVGLQDCAKSCFSTFDFHFRSPLILFPEDLTPAFTLLPAQCPGSLALSLNYKVFTREASKIPSQ